MSLEWTAPEDIGAGAIAGYVVNIYVISGSDSDHYATEDVDEVTTSHTIVGGRLQEQTSYTFAVAAKTDVGQGPLSDLSDAVQTNRGYYVDFSSATRAVQPVDTCRQSPYFHKPAIVIVTSF